MRLIPKDMALGWTPYAWLVYLAIFWFGPVFSANTPARSWALTALGTAIFLPLYFWGYWLPGRKALIPVALITLLGVLYAPINFGASVFFVYASAYLGFAGSAGFAFRLLLIVAAIPPIQAWVMNLPPWFWIPGTLFSLLVGGINIHYAGVRRSQAALRRSQDEVERLAKLAERERIARDLHDLLGHTLTVITRKAELARRLSEKDPARATQEIAEVEEISRQALQEVRSAVTGFRQTDFPTELAQARVALQSARIHFEAQTEAIDIDKASEQVLALALREATTNVLRHSGANTCRVKLQPVGDQVRLIVYDNGKGGETKAGMGLAGMRERVTALGGTFAIDGTSGTTVTVSLPVDRPRQAAVVPETASTFLPPDPEPSGAK
jgi:two-component system sensor histidine kinase DesK